MLPYPPTTGKVVRVAAVLKQGGYRSAENYLGQYRADSERAGFTLDGPLTRMFKDMVRSCSRGVGSPLKSRPLPFARLGELPESRRPWVEHGPVSPKTAILAGSWFLTREIELSCSRACLVRVVDGGASFPLLVPSSQQVLLGS